MSDQTGSFMGESFWQNNSLVTHILFELQPTMIFWASPSTVNYGVFIQPICQKRGLATAIYQ